MIATSTLMFFLMYQHVYEINHATFGVNRLVASAVMEAVMAVMMPGYMWSMYEETMTTIAVITSALLLGGVLLHVNRGQTLIGDTASWRQ